MAAYKEQYFESRDGLRLYYRDYPGDPAKLPVLCLHGLTRNCRDFESLARHIAPQRRVLTPDIRGRGQSQYDPNWMNYHPGTYVADIWALLRQLSIGRVIVIGTSLGGLMAMLMATMRPTTLAAVVLNDVGPEVDPVGLARIQSYAGRLPPVQSWDEAVAQMKLTFGLALPDYSEAQWHEFTRNSFVEGKDGIPRFAADPKIGDSMRAIPPPIGVVQGMWLAFGALLPIPTLAIRGALSDLLSVQTFDKMAREHPDLQRVTVPNRGHPPQLDEPESRGAIDRLLTRVP